MRQIIIFAYISKHDSAISRTHLSRHPGSIAEVNDALAIAGRLILAMTSLEEMASPSSASAATVPADIPGVHTYLAEDGTTRSCV